MKKVLLGFFASALFLSVFGQMHVKTYNFTSFREDQVNVAEILQLRSSAQAKQHPEFGIRPHNAQCIECVELIDKRTANTRHFVDPKDEGHTYTQQSFLPLHYKLNESDMWRTIDARLKPDPKQKGVYRALNQPVPTKCDLNRNLTGLDFGEIEFEFNKNLSMYFFDENNAYSKNEAGNYSKHTVGNEGFEVKDMWPGIDMQAVFRGGEIKTSYVISKPLSLPISKGWLVIEDHFTLPDGYSFVEVDGSEKKTSDGYYKGDYGLKNPQGNILMLYERPVYIDARAWGMHGNYKLIKEGNNYTLQMYVPVDWLNKPENTYPLFIDPIVGNTKLGDFRYTGLPSASLGFASKQFGTCDYHMDVKVPGGSALTNAFVDVEYQLTYDNTCGTPPIPAPYCTFQMAWMEVVNDTCKTTTGRLTCNPAQPPYTGTCTTDSFLVNGARPIRINSFVPNYLACILPQCEQYVIPFTLKNQDSLCGDQCPGYLCARGNMWQMTIEACGFLEGTISQNRNQVCAGQPVEFTANPICGIAPFKFEWSTKEGTGPTNTVLVSDSFTYIHRPQEDVVVICNIFDKCKDTLARNTLFVDVVAAPPASAGNDKFVCLGGTTTIGGNPTTTNATVVWSGEDATVESWLSSTTDLNPTVSVPQGTNDTFFYVVTATDVNCFRDDTVWIYSTPNPVPVIDSSGPTTFCQGSSVNLSTTLPFSGYLWSNGATTRTINVRTAGQYSVTVTDAGGCTGASSNTIPVSITTFPPFNVYPDTIIMYGDSLRLYTNADLGSASVDSFTWYPSVNIECLTCLNPMVAPLTDQYYGLLIYSNGCEVSDSALIRIIYPNNFFIPNGFTPNNDGNNDNFYIQAQAGVQVHLFQVFNRWGEKVHDGNTPWDGTFNGKPSPPGVYTYVTKVTLFGYDRPLYRKGSVTLLR